MSNETNPLKWRVHLPNLLHEVVEANNGCSILAKPMTITKYLLAELAERAIKLDDPELNILMLRLSLYDVEPSMITEQIDIQEARKEMNSGC